MDMEKYFDDEEIKGQVQNVIAPKTAEALKLFCSQSKEFMQAVEQSDETFQDCLDRVTKKIGKSRAVSDFEVFKLAAEFYFKGAEIHFDMRIDLGEDKPDDISVSMDSLLDSLLDF